MRIEPTGRMAAAGRGTADGRLPRGKAPAFTLVELLVVITIIGLLMMILVPTVRMALLQAELARTKAWVVDIGSACTTYSGTYNVYPGQADRDKIGADGTSTAKLTGSQYLADMMLNGRLGISATQDIRTVPAKFGGSPIQLDNTITDRSSNPMAVLYYVAKVGGKDLTQYDVNQNIEYLYGNCGVADAQIGTQFTTTIKDTRFTAVTPLNPGAFIIIAAGKDRKYLTEDDIRFP